MSAQVKVSITEDEWNLAEKAARKHHFKTATAWIRHQIRKNAEEDS